MITPKTRDLCFKIRNKYSELHLIICRHLTDPHEKFPPIIESIIKEIKKLERKFYA